MRLTGTWAGREIYSDRKFFFDIAERCMLHELVINTAALLQPGREYPDDAVIKGYYLFAADPQKMAALIAYHRARDLLFDARHEQHLQTAAGMLVAEIDALDEVALGSFYSFRSKRLAHSTSTRLSNPLVGEALLYSEVASHAPI